MVSSGTVAGRSVASAWRCPQGVRTDSEPRCMRLTSAVRRGAHGRAVCPASGLEDTAGWAPGASCVQRTRRHPGAPGPACTPAARQAPAGAKGRQLTSLSFLIHQIQDGQSQSPHRSNSRGSPLSTCHTYTHPIVTQMPPPPGGLGDKPSLAPGCSTSRDSSCPRGCACPGKAQPCICQTRGRNHRVLRERSMCRRAVWGMGP